MSSSRAVTVTADVPELRRLVRQARAEGKTVGCVPTMGALHAGHVSLMEASRRRCGFGVATIFVNPTQFAPTEDLAKYPRPIEEDLRKCREAGIDVVFTPTVGSIYPAGFGTWVSVEGLTGVLEGASRPTHFRGVTTIVMKLFQLVQPDVAFFGAKDFQQQAVIRQMVRDLDVPVEIVTCPTIREPDGLAMSSRNVYLSPPERHAALVLSETLRWAEQQLHGGVQNLSDLQQQMWNRIAATPLVKIDYAVLCDPDTLQPLSRPQERVVALVAAKVGTTRLIDNLPITLVGGSAEGLADFFDRKRD